MISDTLMHKHVQTRTHALTKKILVRIHVRTYAYIPADTHIHTYILYEKSYIYDI